MNKFAWEFGIWEKNAARNRNTSAAPDTTAAGAGPVVGRASGAQYRAEDAPLAAERQTRGKSDLSALKKVFHSELDFNNSGSLSPGELRFFAWDLSLTDVELARIFDRFDVDGTRLLKLDELLFLVGAQFLMKMRDYFADVVGGAGKKLLERGRTIPVGSESDGQDGSPTNRPSDSEDEERGASIWVIQNPSLPGTVPLPIGGVSSPKPAVMKSKSNVFARSFSRFSYADEGGKTKRPPPLKEKWPSSDSWDEDDAAALSPPPPNGNGIVLGTGSSNASPVSINSIAVHGLAVPEPPDGQVHALLASPAPVASPTPVKIGIGPPTTRSTTSTTALNSRIHIRNEHLARMLLYEAISRELFQQTVTKNVGDIKSSSGGLPLQAVVQIPLDQFNQQRQSFVEVCGNTCWENCWAVLWLGLSLTLLLPALVNPNEANIFDWIGAIFFYGLYWWVVSSWRIHEALKNVVRGMEAVLERVGGSRGRATRRSFSFLVL